MTGSHDSTGSQTIPSLEDIRSLARLGDLSPMTLDVLERHNREADELDFKGSLDPTGFHAAEIAKDIAAMANTGGGFIVVGVEETGPNTWEWTGVRPHDDTKNWDRAIFGQSVLGFIDPQPACEICKILRPTAAGDVPFYLVRVLPGDRHVHVMAKPGLRPGGKQSKAPPNFREDDVFVRRNTSSQLAGRQDYDRMIEARTSDRVRALLTLPPPSQTPARSPLPAADMGSALAAWRGADRDSAEAVREAMNTVTTALDALLVGALQAVEERDDDYVRVAAERLREVYEWGADERYGLREPGPDDAGLEFGTLCVEALARFYVLGAKAAQGRRLSLCRELATEYAVPRPAPRAPKPLSTHPLFDDPRFQPRDRTAYFRRAWDIVRTSELLKVPQTRGEPEDSLCQFDFLVEVFLRLSDPGPGWLEHCPNYAFCGDRRVAPIAIALVESEADPTVIPPEHRANLPLALVGADDLPVDRQFSWDARWWWPREVLEYLREHDAMRHYRHR